MRAASLTLTLFLFWLALAGDAPPGLIVAGAGCAMLCMVVARRAGILDSEGHPVHLLGRAATYIPWLLWEIAKSTWTVTRLVIHPRLPISPTMTTVEPTQRTPLGVSIHANSITLTPGTITVAVRRNMLVVHALTEAGANDVESGVMDARVTRFEKAS